MFRRASVPAGPMTGTPAGSRSAGYRRCAIRLPGPQRLIVQVRLPHQPTQDPAEELTMRPPPPSAMPPGTRAMHAPKRGRRSPPHACSRHDPARGRGGRPFPPGACARSGRLSPQYGTEGPHARSTQRSPRSRDAGGSVHQCRIVRCVVFRPRRRERGRIASRGPPERPCTAANSLPPATRTVPPSRTWRMMVAICPSGRKPRRS